MCRQEPFRVFFPLGLVLAWIGIGHWIAYYAGWTSTYSCLAHGVVQIQGFLLAFALGFLLTALPRRTASAPPPAMGIWSAALALLVTTAAAFAEQWWIAEGATIAIVVGVVVFAASRFAGASAGRRPPAPFVLIPIALACNVVGAVLLAWGASRGGAVWGVATGRLLVEQGLFLCLVMGAGALVLPLMSGATPPADIGSSPEIARHAAGYAMAGLVVVVSLVAEAAGSARIAPIVRGLVVAVTLAIGAGAWRRPTRPGWNRQMAWVAVWLVPVGIVLAGVLPDYRVPALHVTFIGGFALLALSVATHVTAAHLDLVALRDGPSLVVATIAGASLVAMAGRVTADATVTYFEHLAAAGAIWIAGTAVWMVVLLPRWLGRRRAPGDGRATGDGRGNGDAHEQARVVELLASPAAYAHPVGAVTHLQTHISHVFLAGDYVYKLKKAVRFPFLDFESVAARERLCGEEVRLNRRLAPAVYLGVVPVTAAGGRLRVGGPGDAVEWLVRMRRLPAARCLAVLVEQGTVTVAAMERLAERLARFHAGAPVVPGGEPDALAAAWDENLAGVRPLVGRFLAAEDLAVLADFGRTFVVRHDAVLRARPVLGHVRDGHGDLRVDHVYLLDEALAALADAPGVPAGIQVVDCIEFAPAFRAIDVAADIAFLVMELESVGRPDLGARFLAAYAAAANDPVVHALVPYYACHRGTVRGKVEALAAEEPEIGPDARTRAAERARDRLALAGRFAWRSGDPVVVACMGLSGTGKSAVAELVATMTGWAVTSSDVLRRTVSPSEVEARYAPAARAAVYERMGVEAERALAARESIVLDATFLARAERDRLARLVRGYGRSLLFLECVADEAVVRRRLAARDATAISEARWDVYVQQRAEREPLGADEPALTLDTTPDLVAVRRELVPRLWAWRQGRPLPDAAPSR